MLVAAQWAGIFKNKLALRIFIYYFFASTN